jgi:hypothetical protein
MSPIYYDSIQGRNRIKRRYVWAGCAFVLGMTVGMVLGHLL